MPEVHFRNSGRFGSDERNLYQKFNNREFHPGELAALDNDKLDLCIEKACCAPYPVSRVISHSGYRVTRTAAHVRSAKHDLVVVRLLQRGSATLSQQHMSAAATPGDILINRSTSPTSMVGLPDSAGVQQVIVLLVPASLICGPRGVHEFAPLALSRSLPSVRVAATLLELLAEEGEGMSYVSAQRLTEHVIDQLRESLLEQGGFAQGPSSLPDERYRTVCDYISLHYSDPQLSLTNVAESCQLSVRYVCHLFNRHGTSFAKYLWSYRLERVREWLSDPTMSLHAIGALAHRAGFKSAAHLCQSFKRTYQCSPGDLRRSERLDVRSSN